MLYFDSINAIILTKEIIGVGEILYKGTEWSSMKQKTVILRSGISLKIYV